MSAMYCYWTGTRELENGDLEIVRYMDQSPSGGLEAETVLVIPAVERGKVAKALLGDLEPIVTEMYDRFHLHRDSTLITTTPACRRAFGDVFRSSLRHSEQDA